MHLAQTAEDHRVSFWTSATFRPPATPVVAAALRVSDDNVLPGHGTDQTLIYFKETHIPVCSSAVVVDTLFQSSAEGEGLSTNTVKGARCVDTPSVLTVRRILTLIYICLFLWRDTAVAISGKDKGWGADAVEGI